MKKILLTGGAGFIGFHLTKYILEHYPDLVVVSIDNLNAYYDEDLKKGRLKQLEALNAGRWIFHKIDIVNKRDIERLFEEHKFSAVINLAAQAGVRYARENPDAYIETNLKGFFNILHAAAQKGVERFLYASSSSVYGANQEMPFRESHRITSPMSLYAATKSSNEMMAAAYFYTHGLKAIGMRFFNVYGPWGRPDMAYYKWAQALTTGDKIELRNDGEMYRDMTYIDDAVKAIAGLAFRYDWQGVTHETFNIGSGDPVKIADLLSYIQHKLGVKSANIDYVEKGSEEPLETFADTSKLQEAIGFVPDTHYKLGIDNFIQWFKEYSC